MTGIPSLLLMIGVFAASSSARYVDIPSDKEIQVGDLISIDDHADNNKIAYEAKQQVAFLGSLVDIPGTDNVEISSEEVQIDGSRMPVEVMKPVVDIPYQEIQVGASEDAMKPSIDIPYQEIQIGDSGTQATNPNLGDFVDI